MSGSGDEINRKNNEEQNVENRDDRIIEESMQCEMEKSSFSYMDDNPEKHIEETSSNEQVECDKTTMNSCNEKKFENNNCLNELDELTDHASNILTQCNAESEEKEKRENTNENNTILNNVKEETSCSSDKWNDIAESSKKVDSDEMVEVDKDLSGDESIINEPENEQKKKIKEVETDKEVENDVEEEYMDEQQEREKDLDTDWSKCQIKTCIRVKPLELYENYVPNEENAIVKCVGNKIILHYDNKGEERKYEFNVDKVFSQDCTQNDIWDNIRFCVDSFFDFKTASVFAHGHTGTGKTYTMIGPDVMELIKRKKGKLKKGAKKVNTSQDSFMHTSSLRILNKNVVDTSTEKNDGNVLTSEQNISNVNTKNMKAYYARKRSCSQPILILPPIIQRYNASTSNSHINANFAHIKKLYGVTNGLNSKTGSNKRIGDSLNESCNNNTKNENVKTFLEYVNETKHHIRVTKEDVYSILNSKNRGMIPRACEDIMKRLDRLKQGNEKPEYHCSDSTKTTGNAIWENNTNVEKNVKVYVSYMQLYNDRIFDLLNPYNEPYPCVNSVKSNFANNTTYVTGLLNIEVNTIEELIELLIDGTCNRACRITKTNEMSTRSHSIFKIELKEMGKFKNETLRCGNLLLVDLAGNEKYEISNEKTYTAEVCSINRSLSALSQCINELSRKSKTISYRNSVLTRLLQGSLGGCSKTIFICTISACTTNVRDTISSLQLAVKAKKIQGEKSSYSNKDLSDDMKKLRKEINFLKKFVFYQYTTSANEYKKRLKVLKHFLSNTLYSLLMNNEDISTSKTIYEKENNSSELLEEKESKENKNENYINENVLERKEEQMQSNKNITDKITNVNREFEKVYNSCEYASFNSLLMKWDLNKSTIKRIKAKIKEVEDVDNQNNKKDFWFNHQGEVNKNNILKFIQTHTIEHELQTDEEEMLHDKNSYGEGGNEEEVKKEEKKKFQEKHIDRAEEDVDVFHDHIKENKRTNLKNKILLKKKEINHSNMENEKMILSTYDKESSLKNNKKEMNEVKPTRCMSEENVDCQMNIYDKKNINKCNKEPNEVSNNKKKNFMNRNVNDKMDSSNNDNYIDLKKKEKVNSIITNDTFEKKDNDKSNSMKNKKEWCNKVTIGNNDGFSSGNYTSHDLNNIKQNNKKNENLKLNKNSFSCKNKNDNSATNHIHQNKLKHPNKRNSDCQCISPTRSTAESTFNNINNKNATDATNQNKKTHDDKNIVTNANNSVTINDCKDNINITIKNDSINPHFKVFKEVKNKGNVVENVIHTKQYIDLHQLKINHTSLNNADINNLVINKIKNSNIHKNEKENKNKTFETINNNYEFIKGEELIDISNKKHALENNKHKLYHCNNENSNDRRRSISENGHHISLKSKTIIKENVEGKCTYYIEFDDSKKYTQSKKDEIEETKKNKECNDSNEKKKRSSYSTHTNTYITENVGETNVTKINTSKTIAKNPLLTEIEKNWQTFEKKIEKIIIKDAEKCKNLKPNTSDDTNKNSTKGVSNNENSVITSKEKKKKKEEPKNNSNKTHIKANKITGKVESILSKCDNTTNNNEEELTIRKNETQKTLIQSETEKNKGVKEKTQKNSDAYKNQHLKKKEQIINSANESNINEEKLKENTFKFIEDNVSMNNDIKKKNILNNTIRTNIEKEKEEEEEEKVFTPQLIDIESSFLTHDNSSNIYHPGEEINTYSSFKEKENNGNKTFTYIDRSNIPYHNNMTETVNIPYNNNNNNNNNINPLYQAENMIKYNTAYDIKRIDNINVKTEENKMSDFLNIRESNTKNKNINYFNNYNVIDENKETYMGNFKYVTGNTINEQLIPYNQYNKAYNTAGVRIPFNIDIKTDNKNVNANINHISKCVEKNERDKWICNRSDGENNINRTQRKNMVDDPNFIYYQNTKCNNNNNNMLTPYMFNMKGGDKAFFRDNSFNDASLHKIDSNQENQSKIKKIHQINFFYENDEKENMAGNNITGKTNVNFPHWEMPKFSKINYPTSFQQLTPNESIVTNKQTLQNEKTNSNNLNLNSVVFYSNSEIYEKLKFSKNRSSDLNQNKVLNGMYSPRFDHVDNTKKNLTYNFYKNYNNPLHNNSVGNNNRNMATSDFLNGIPSIKINEIKYGKSMGLNNTKKEYEIKKEKSIK